MVMIPKTSDSTLNAADAVRAQAEDEYARYRSRAELSPAAQQSGIAKSYLKAKTAMDGLQSSADNYAKTSLADAKRKAFGIDDLAGFNDPVKRTSVAMSMRDALDRVGQIETPQEASDLLQQANTIGDEVLARAIGQHAWNNNTFGQWQDVLDAFTADRPTAATAIAQLNNSTTPMNPRDMWAFVLPQPSELSGMHDAQIQQIADQWPAI